MEREKNFLYRMLNRDILFVEISRNESLRL